MKAVRYHAYGTSDVLVLEEAPNPVAGPGQVVIRVAGSAFNPVDAAIRLGIVQEQFPVKLPHTPGIEVSGTVTAVGEGVSVWNAGDAAIATLPMTAPGSAADYVAAPADALAPAPRSVDLADAAALPVAGLTAWQALFEHAGLRSGQSILINGAGGGVGGLAIQLAKQAGATVTATASARSRDRVQAAGADRIVDYTATPVLEALAGERFDVVLHLVRSTPEEVLPYQDLVAEAGVLVTTAAPGIEALDHAVRTIQMYMRSDAAQLADLAARVDAGTLKIEVAERLPLAALPSVHDRGLAGQLAGKTVLVP